MDQKDIDRGAEDALKKSDVKLTMEIFFSADGIRAAEIPDGVESEIATLITKRMPPMIPAAEISQPGSWRLIMRAVSFSMRTRIEA